MKRDVLASSYKPMLNKTLDTALRTFLLSELIGIGPVIVEVLVKHIVAICEGHYADQNRLKVGQMLWCAVDKEDPPTWGKTMATTRLKPVILTVVDAEDIAAVIGRKPVHEINHQRVIRVSREADAQGGVLAQADLAMIFGYSGGQISHMMTKEERQTGRIVPRRGNVHDMGSTLTHKRIICYLHFVDGKQTPEISRETRHTSGSVDRYLKDFSRVRQCHSKGMQAMEIAVATGLGVRLINEYIELIEDFGLNNGVVRASGND